MNTKPFDHTQPWPQEARPSCPSWQLRVTMRERGKMELNREQESKREMGEEDS